MDAAPVARLYLDTVIAPVRSLPRRGFAILMGVFIALNLGLGLLFLRMGAAPVPIFLGIDVAAVSIAFAVNYRHARRSERVQVSAEEVRVERERGGRVETVWTSPTAFTRVGLEQTGRYGLQVRLILSRRRLAVGDALGPLEREALAQTLQDAIRAARAERHQS
jgi:uncharacterized membrane protein